MFILAVIVVFLTLGNCTVTVRSECTTECNDNFRVDVIRKNKNGMANGTPQTFYEGNAARSYYDIGDEIKLICRLHLEKNQSSMLKWFENRNHEFGTHKTRQYQNATLRLTINPDRDDDGLNLTCRAIGPQVHDEKGASQFSKSYRDKDISIELLGPNKSSLKSDTRTINSQYIKRGQPLGNVATCNRTVRFRPNTQNKKLHSFLITNHKNIIEQFEEKDNGTIVSCISYVNITGITSDIETFVRRKGETNIFYLEPEPVMITTGTEKSGNGPPNIAAIVGGVLGTIIFILITAAIVLWFRKNRRSSPDDQAADRVIYAEIEERLPQRPPPQREEPPYAKIIGSLVPKQQPPRVDEPLYYEIAE